MCPLPSSIAFVPLCKATYETIMAKLGKTVITTYKARK